MNGRALIAVTRKYSRPQDTIEMNQLI